MNPKKYSDEEFIKAICDKRNITIKMVLESLGYCGVSGSKYDLVGKIIKKHNLDTSHFVGSKFNSTLKGSKLLFRKPIDYWLTTECPTKVTSWKLKNRLFQEGIKEKLCEHCKNTQWMGKDIPLELDHINGNKKDNRLENLQILCPNCHALTPTYKTKNWKKRKT